MVYEMQIYCYGACRNNGRPNAVASAAILFKKEKKTSRGRYPEILPTILAQPVNQSKSETTRPHDCVRKGTGEVPAFATQSWTSCHHSYRLKVCIRLHDRVTEEVDA
ncbi:uncharacterized protein BDV14DRAFT_179415 [Aspergillus stella-maris]|uniref:uncharacterized protein n=1 Tax=Aspergillus stella-maris TaxID=1810926 RepID=UPI003CCCD369